MCVRVEWLCLLYSLVVGLLFVSNLNKLLKCGSHIPYYFLWALIILSCIFTSKQQTHDTDRRTTTATTQRNAKKSEQKHQRHRKNSVCACFICKIIFFTFISSFVHKHRHDNNCPVYFPWRSCVTLIFIYIHFRNPCVHRCKEQTNLVVSWKYLHNHFDVLNFDTLPLFVGVIAISLTNVNNTE